MRQLTQPALPFKTTTASLPTKGAMQHVVRCTIHRLLGHARAEDVVFEEVRTMWAVHVSPVRVSHCPRGVLHDSRMAVAVRPRYVSTANAHYHIQEVPSGRSGLRMITMANGCITARRLTIIAVRGVLLLPSVETCYLGCTHGKRHIAVQECHLIGFAFILCDSEAVTFR